MSLLNSTVPRIEFLSNIFICSQFVEIKGSLFKKIDKGFLYHISCSDVKERFLYIVLLAIVFIRNMTEFSWDPRKKLNDMIVEVNLFTASFETLTSVVFLCLEHVWVILPDAMLVFVAEILVDWVKHAFILKFNEIPADVSLMIFTVNYNKYTQCKLSVHSSLQ